MNQASLSHPSAQQLQAFGLGRVGPEDRAWIESHLGECLECGQLLECLPPDPLVNLVRVAAAAGPDPVDPPQTFESCRRNPETQEVVAGAIAAEGSKVAPPLEASTESCCAKGLATPSPARPTGPALPEQFGRYRILQRLGQGGMGSVYLAHDTQLERQVALKVPHFSPSATAQFIERFCREARAAAQLDHPNLCPVFDVGEIDGIHYLTMPFVEGQPLSALLEKTGLLPVGEVVALVRKMALALAEAHQKGIVHRDLKPSNVMINQRREPVIMDFGLARHTAEEVRLTHSGIIVGTPAYMSPEQVEGQAEAIGPACDIYSLGVILYELLTGKLPFRGEVMAVLRQIPLEEPLPPSHHRPDLEPALEQICLKAMAKKSVARFATMAELAAALERYLQNEAAPQAEPPAAAGPPTSRRRPWPWLALAGAAACLLGGVIFYLTTNHGTIKIELTDPEAKVEIKVDGDSIDIVGLEKPLKLQAGPHQLRITGEDFETVSRQFTVRRGANPVLRVELKPAAVAAIAAATPGDAKIVNPKVSEKAKASPEPQPKIPPTTPVKAKKFQNWKKGVVVREKKTLEGHTDIIKTVAVSSDGKWVASGSLDHTVKLWEVATGQERFTLRGHTDHVYSVAFSSDGKWLASGSIDSTVKLWEVATGKELSTLRSPSKVRGVAFSPDCKFLASSTLKGGNVTLWDIATGKERLLPMEHKGTVRSVVFSNDGQWLATAGEDLTVKLWELATSQVRHTLRRHTDKVKTVAFSPDSTWLASGSLDGTVMLWDVASGQERQTLAGHFKGVHGLAFSGDGKLLASAGEDKIVILWEVASGRKLQILRGHTAAVFGVAFSSDGQLLASASADHTVKLWEVTG